MEPHPDPEDFTGCAMRSERVPLMLQRMWAFVVRMLLACLRFAFGFGPLHEKPFGNSTSPQLHARDCMQFVSCATRTTTHGLCDSSFVVRAFGHRAGLVCRRPLCQDMDHGRTCCYCQAGQSSTFVLDPGRLEGGHTVQASSRQVCFVSPSASGRQKHDAPHIASCGLGGWMEKARARGV